MADWHAAREHTKPAGAAVGRALRGIPAEDLRQRGAGPPEAEWLIGWYWQGRDQAPAVDQSATRSARGPVATCPMESVWRAAYQHCSQSGSLYEPGHETEPAGGRHCAVRYRPSVQQPALWPHRAHGAE